MSEQETFNKVRDHLLKQRAKSKSGDNCVYLSEDGLRCAAGCLLPAGYVPESEWNCRSISSVISFGPEEMKQAFFAHRAIIIRLQTIHDQLKVEEWPQALKALAIDRGLVP